jgi:hypothetical protein
MPAHHIRSYRLSMRTNAGNAAEGHPPAGHGPGAPHAAADAPHAPGWYEIRLKGRLDPRWADWFDGLRLTHEGDGTTLLRGPVVDQAALHGLLRKVRDLGLPLIAVIRVDGTQANEPHSAET